MNIKVDLVTMPVMMIEFIRLHFRDPCAQSGESDRQLQTDILHYCFSLFTAQLLRWIRYVGFHGVEECRCWRVPVGVSIGMGAAGPGGVLGFLSISWIFRTSLSLSSV
jgi:hypothetical protein